MCITQCSRGQHKAVLMPLQLLIAAVLLADKALYLVKQRRQRDLRRRFRLKLNLQLALIGQRKAAGVYRRTVRWWLSRCHSHHGGHHQALKPEADGARHHLWILALCRPVHCRRAFYARVFWRQRRHLDQQTALAGNLHRLQRRHLHKRAIATVQIPQPGALASRVSRHRGAVDQQVICRDPLRRHSHHRSRKLGQLWILGPVQLPKVGIAPEQHRCPRL